MDNKLQQLTEKLYAEGLEKGKAEAQAMVEKANSDGAAIVKKAEDEAAKIVAKAKADAAELARNAASDVRMASLQTVSALRTQIENFVVTGVAHAQVGAAFADGALARELIVRAVEAWNPSSENGVKVIVPENYLNEARAAVANRLDHGVEVVYDGKVRVPFRIAPREGGYYVSFADADFENLLSSALRPDISKLLFDK